jgi:hypothetical protein
VHGYPHSPDRSTLVLEADPSVLRNCDLIPANRRLDRLGPLVTERLRCTDLRLHTLPWRPFTTVRCEQWTAGALVLLGDAAHALHFSVGSGTSLALDDGRELAEHIAAGTLPNFESTRRKQVDAMLTEAEISRRWFERLARRRRLNGVRTAFALRSRRETNDIDYLTARDPGFVAQAVAELGLDATPRHIPSPRSAPLEVGKLSLTGRTLATSDHPGGDAHAAAELATPDGRYGDPVGVVVRDLAGAWRADDADFLIVPSAAGGRLPATELADTVRGQVDRPVLLLDAHRLRPVDIDTQITAGAFDLHAPVEHSTLSRLGPGTALSLRPKDPSR